MAASTGSRFVAWLSRALPTVITLGLAGIGAAAGFEHTHDWAEENGQHGWLAWADAVVIECMCLVAGFEIHKDRKASRSPRFPLTVLVIGFGIQMTAQVAMAGRDTPAGWLLAAVPALGFLVVVKLLMRRLPHHTTGHTTGHTETEETDSTPPETAPVGARTVERAPAEPAAATPVRQATPTPAPALAEPQPNTAVTGRQVDPVAVPRVKLPPALADRITTLVGEIRAEGREPTTEDIRRAVKVPEPMAAQILAGLPAGQSTTPINGHAVT